MCRYHSSFLYKYILVTSPWFLGLFLNISVAQNAQLTGQVIDSTEKNSLGYASVMLYKSSDSTQIGGILSDTTGSFFLSNISSGNYYLVVRFLGYKPLIRSSIEIASYDQLDLGIIGLSPTTRLLEEIEITGRKSRSLFKIDRQVFSAGQFENARGGSATDIIRNLPGISINALGEITLRGSQGFIVMIDGRQMQTDAGSLLNQLPANAIEDIEILTTPSAKYDPDGKGGIINITTRKGATDGVFIQANGLYGLPSVEPYDNADASRRFGGDVTVNVRKGKWDISGGLDYRRDDIAGLRIGYVNTYLDEVLTEYPSEGERSFDREQYSGRISAIFQPTERQRWSLNFFAGDRTQYRTADILYQPQQRSVIPQSEFLGTEAYWDLYDSRGTVMADREIINSLVYYNENLRVREGDFLIAGLDYQWQIDDESSISFSGLYEHTLLGGPTDNASLAWPNIIDTLQYQFNTNDNPLDGVRIKVDYSRKVGGINWESGYQFRYLNHPGDFFYLDRDLKNGQWIVNPEFTNRIELERQIHGIYSQISGEQGKWQYNLGLRLEYMDRTVSLAEPDTLYEYQIFQPFPTLNLQYSLGKGWTTKLGYSRRIERTTTFKMTPFPEREHNETLEQGDAELLPEFINLVELGLVKNFGDNFVFATAYVRGVQNVINRVNTVYNDSILNRIYTNAGNARAIGWEMGGNLYPAKWCQFYVGTNIYNYQIEGTLFGDEIDTENWIYSVNTNIEFIIQPTLKLQAALNYLSRRVTAQGVDSRFYNPSLVLSKSFLDGKLSASLQWLSMDMGLLESNEQRITTVRDNFYTTTNYIYEVDRVIFTLNFQLNQPSKDMKFIKSEFGEKEF